jgi:hypothetical protein
MAYDPILALKTKEAIDAAIYADQGRMYRHYLREVILDVDDAFDDTIHDRFRSHMGISTSGRECARELWYKWRWATPVKIAGKLLRLFNRGHLEEARFAACLMSAGIKLWRMEAPGKQFRVSYFGGHYGSAIDGVGVGFPEMPAMHMLTEMKTHNAKSFKKLAGETDSDGNVVTKAAGVMEAKLEHYVQMVQYMEYYNLDYGMYCAVNKDTDELYFEIVARNDKLAQAYRDRSHRIMFAKEAPPKLSTNASFWKCKYCDEKRVCHFNQAPDFNCRTCSASYPKDDGNWYCSTHDHAIIDKTRQLTGCPEYSQHISFNQE